MYEDYTVGDDGIGYDAASWMSCSNDLASQGFEMWTQAGDLEHLANEVWQIEGYSDTYFDVHNASLDSEALSNAFYQSSDDYWYGSYGLDSSAAAGADYSVSAGYDYTASDVSAGYSSFDTSFVEPASWADNSSMIADNDPTSFL